MLKFALEMKEKLSTEIRRLLAELEAKKELRDDSEKQCNLKIDRRHKEDDNLEWKRKQGELAKKENELSELDKKLKRLKERKKGFEIEKIRFEFEFTRLEKNNKGDDDENKGHIDAIAELETDVRVTTTTIEHHNKKISKQRALFELLKTRLDDLEIENVRLKAEYQQRKKTLIDNKELQRAMSVI